MSVDEYIQLIASPTIVSLDKLSNTDRKGIKAGKVYSGMTKQGVRVALGYPAVHRTPSLEDNTWIYWRNRFQTIAIEFDQSGKVVHIR
jgi:outer membrane protein assembly factor BamE (lipoprotein component of BamABCDE complex)